MSNTFSSKNRSSIIDHLSQSEFDLLVVGGGITGAGIALDAASRGLKVALVEMQDFASGTSGRSTKLIHGGLRYLKQFELKLVAEVGREREIVHKNAPHLTKPEHMLLPIVKGGSLNRFSARIAMFIYELIAGVKHEEKHKSLNKDQALIREPLLKKENLLGGILFYEYRTDDARLTIEVLKTAIDHGAVAINYTKADSFIYSNGKISGANITDQISGATYQIKAKYVVNAAGPWVDEVDELDTKTSKHKLHITKGVHLVVDWKKLPVAQSAYFDTFDKRMIFVIPRQGKTYIGTTDTFYEGDVVNPEITKQDIDYLIKCVNDFFPQSQLHITDIESGWAGLRPLVNKPGKGPSEISRKDEMFESATGLITIAGGKLTGYRKMAKRVVDLVARKFEESSRQFAGGSMQQAGDSRQDAVGRRQYAEGSREKAGDSKQVAVGRKRIADCSTHTIKLSGGKFMEGSSDQFVQSRIKKGTDLGLSLKESELLTYRYGANVDEVFEIISRNERTSELPVGLYAQLIYCIEKEMCVSPADFFIRRTASMYFDVDSVIKYKDALIRQMQSLMGWDKQLTEKYEMELNASLKAVQELQHKF